MKLHQKRLRNIPLISIALIILLSCSQTKEIISQSDRITDNEKLIEIVENDWERKLKNRPEIASYDGDRRYNQKWSDISIEKLRATHKEDKAIIAKLATIEYNLLSDSNKINYDLFKWQTQSKIDKFIYFSHLMPIDQLEGVQFAHQEIEYFPLENLQDYKDWLKRLDALPTLISQTTALMKIGMAKRIMPPKITISRIPAQVKHLLVTKPQDSLFFSKFTGYPSVISKSQQQQLTQQALSIIKEKVTPAYQEFYDFLTNEYLPACRESVGLSDLENGDSYYQYLIHHNTTTKLSADEIHKIGLKEVARNKKEMNKIIQEVGFKGDFNEFLHHLRTEPQFYYKTSADLLEGYQAISKRIDPQLPKLFGKLPRMPYGVIPIPPSMAPDSTTAYYYAPSADGTRAGYYYVNLYQPETRPKYEMEVLSVHEAVPGHHLQIALQMELEELPSFRRYTTFTVFNEGWALYSERLGYDMGLYKDPYSKFGQLTYDMWRSIRLVVDTGLHHKGWTRQQAIDYFLKNAAKSEEDIINEIDRYISWPGQALAYKIGQLKIIELRNQAESVLGNNFDIRYFHDMILGNGPVTLTVLENNVTQWIESQKEMMISPAELN